MANELQKLIKSILDEPEKLNEMSKDEIMELRKKTNPYGVIVPANKSWINFSIINMRESYLKRLYMVSLVGYLFRTLEEYQYEPTEEQIKMLSSINGVDERKEKETEFIKEFERDKLGAKRFLKRNFDYNPDKHIKISYTENKEDPERISRYEEFMKMMKLSKQAKNIGDGIKENHEDVAKDLKEKIMNTYQTTINVKNIIQNVIECIKNLSNNLSSNLSSNIFDEMKASLIKYHSDITSICNDVKPIADVLSSEDIKTALAIGIPVDVFYQWDRYMTNHYEDIREVVSVLYSEKPDVEYAIQYIDNFKSEDEARAHRQRWEGSFISTVTTIENGAWSILGPFKKNRERIEFYNKNTEVLRQMLNQIESDHKMGEEFMKKKVRQGKKENILKHGMDDKGLAEYNAAIGSIESLGAKKILSESEKRMLVEAKKIKDDSEVPDDAVAVDIYYNDPNKGFDRRRFHTEAVDIEEQSEEYMKEIGKKSSMGEKIIRSRTGEKKSISKIRSEKFE